MKVFVLLLAIISAVLAAPTPEQVLVLEGGQQVQYQQIPVQTQVQTVVVQPARRPGLFSGIAGAATSVVAGLGGAVIGGAGGLLSGGLDGGVQGAHAGAFQGQVLGRDVAHI